VAKIILKYGRSQILQKTQEGLLLIITNLRGVDFEI